MNTIIWTVLYKLTFVYYLIYNLILNKRIATMFSLTNLIETKREQLFYLGKLYGLTHLKTIQCSQQLDVLINFSLKEQITAIKLQENI